MAPVRPSFSACLLFLAACGAVPAESAPRGDADDGLAQVAAWMQGTFSSRAQHAASPRDFFDIRLVMLPIWRERSDGVWFYVEQAVAAAPARPYRQRVYHLVALPDGAVRSDVYTLPGDPLAHAGAWRRAEPLAGITPAALQLRDGCSIRLVRHDADTWVGGTEGTGCASERDGAAYATAEVTLTANGMETLDRGFDAAGQQVWGSEHGPYRFQKHGDGPPAD